MSSSPPLFSHNDLFLPSSPEAAQPYPGESPPPAQTATVRPRRQPRLSPTPRLFRDIFSPSAPDGLQRTLPNAQFRQSFVDVSRALTDANRAVQHAEQALQPSSVVDLTQSPPRRVPQADMPRNTRQPPPAVPRVDAHDQHLSPNVTPPGTRQTETRHITLAQMRQLMRNGAPPDYLFRRPHSGPSQEDIRRDEDRAIQQQREARATWVRRQQRAQQTQTPTRPTSSSSASTQRTVSDVESVDLTKIDDKSTLGSALAKQRQDAVSSQRAAASPTARSALTGYKCPICMETPKDATTTICGHLFCHRCIIDTLKWSEQQRTADNARKMDGVCPVCRKTLKRKDKAGSGRHIIPLQVKLVTQKVSSKDKGKKRAWADSEITVLRSEKRKREDSQDGWHDLAVVNDQA